MISTDDFTLWLGRRVETLRMRQGIGNPKMLTIVRLCQILNISLSEFFTEEKEGEPLWHILG